MTLSEMIRNGARRPATAIPATPAIDGKEQPVTIASGTSITSPPAVPSLAPTPPLQSGWFVVYRDEQDRLRGGADEPTRGTVAAIMKHPTGWIVTLTDGSRVHQTRILSVARTDGEGKVVEAWTVKDHGIDGMKGEPWAAPARGRAHLRPTNWAA